MEELPVAKPRGGNEQPPPAQRNCDCLRSSQHRRWSRVRTLGRNGSVFNEIVGLNPLALFEGVCLLLSSLSEVVTMIAQSRICMFMTFEAEWCMSLSLSFGKSARHIRASIHFYSVWTRHWLSNRLVHRKYSQRRRQYFWLDIVQPMYGMRSATLCKVGSCWAAELSFEMPHALSVGLASQRFSYRYSRRQRVLLRKLKMRFYLKPFAGTTGQVLTIAFFSSASVLILRTENSITFKHVRWLSLNKIQVKL